MGKRSHGEDSQASNTPVKKEKIPEFNGTTFKAMLKEPRTAMKGEYICTVSQTHLIEVINFISVIIIILLWLILSFISPAGLETFISTAKKLPCSDLYDVVEGYVKISMECAEIFKLLEGEKHVESEVSLLSGGWD